MSRLKGLNNNLKQEIMNREQILKELNIQLQIVRVNNNFWTRDKKLRNKANKRIDILTSKLEAK